MLFIAFFIINSTTKKESEQHKVQKYPWQIDILADGKIRVFNMVLDETPLKDINVILNSEPTLAVFDSGKKSTLEAYYKSIVLGGLTGDFIFTLDASEIELNKLKSTSQKQKRAEDNGRRFDLDKDATASVKNFRVKNLIYIPMVQLDETMVIKRFGEPYKRIQMTSAENKEPSVIHFLYPDKGLDLILNEKGKEVMQYISPRQFSVLLEPLQQNQNQSH